ncbi:MAG: putative aminohydrolase SsnA [Treponema sp.]|nr:putative aminohydrolase SsnA [Treponema sp.]
MIFIKHGQVITKNSHKPFIKDGALFIKENRILKIGTTSELEKDFESFCQKTREKIQVIDANGKLVLPGFINCHEHIYSQFARGAGIPKESPQDFLSVLEGTWWYLDKALTLENVYYSAASTYLESIRNGVTFVNDHHASFGAIRGSLNQIEKAAEFCGMRTCLCYEISNRHGKEKLKESIEENFDFCNRVNSKNNSMIKGLIGLHAAFTLDDETLNNVTRQNVKGIGYHVHIAEGLYDEEHCQKTYGCSVVERFEKAGLLGSKTLAGHCIHVSDSDMELLKATGTIVIHNPESNMANGVGSPDILKMLDKGILVGLGTDGYTHDITESLKFANCLQKNRNLNPSRGFQEALQLLQNNSNIASNILEDKVGILEEGYLADVIIVNYKPCTPLKNDNIAGHLMFGISGSMTDTTIVNGKILMRDRRILCCNEESVLKEARESAEHLWRTL